MASFFFTRIYHTINIGRDCILPLQKEEVFPFMVKARNIVVVSGKIKAIRENRESASIILENQGERVTSFPIFSIYDLELLKDFHVHMRVRITAHVENRKSVDMKDSVIYIKDFVVDKIEQQKRMLAPYLLNEEVSPFEGGYPRDTNTCLMIGKVYHIYHPRDDFAILTLQIPNGTKTNQADVVCFKRQAEQAAECMEGDAIAVGGYLTSKLEDREDVMVQKQSIVARDLAFISGVI